MVSAHHLCDLHSFLQWAGVGIHCSHHSESNMFFLFLYRGAHTNREINFQMRKENVIAEIYNAQFQANISILYPKNVLHIFIKLKYEYIYSWAHHASSSFHSESQS